MSDELSITILSDELLLASARKSAKASLMPSLLKLMFFRPDDIFHYCETESFLTMIGSRDAMLETLPKVEFHDTVWLPIRFDESVSQSSTLIQSVVEPLARVHINVFNMSVYSFPIILVPKESIDQIIMQLKCFCRINYNGQVIDPIKVTPFTDALPHHGHPLSVEAYSVRLCHIDTTSQDYHLKWLIEQFLLTPNDEFLSYTRMEDEISLVVPSRYMDDSFCLSRGITCDSFQWIPIRIVGPVAVLEAGVVASTVSILAPEDFQIFYHSVIDTDFVFVPSEQLERVRAILARFFSIAAPA